jgi:hypothetical protein
MQKSDDHTYLCLVTKYFVILNRSQIVIFKFQNLQVRICIHSMHALLFLLKKSEDTIFLSLHITSNIGLVVPKFYNPPPLP